MARHALYSFIYNIQVLFIEHIAPSDLQRKRHTAIECIPIPRAAAAQSVGYFKKALLGTDATFPFFLFPSASFAFLTMLVLSPS